MTAALAPVDEIVGKESPTKCLFLLSNSLGKEHCFLYEILTIVILQAYLQLELHQVLSLWPLAPPLATQNTY